MQFSVNNFNLGQVTPCIFSDKKQACSGVWFVRPILDTLFSIRLIAVKMFTVFCSIYRRTLDWLSRPKHLTSRHIWQRRCVSLLAETAVSLTLFFFFFILFPVDLMVMWLVSKKLQSYGESYEKNGTRTSTF